jgi:hypothetical protein
MNIRQVHGITIFGKRSLNELNGLRSPVHRAICYENRIVLLNSDILNALPKMAIYRLVANTANNKAVIGPSKIAHVEIARRIGWQPEQCVGGRILMLGLQAVVSAETSTLPSDPSKLMSVLGRIKVQDPTINAHMVFVREIPFSD